MVLSKVRDQRGPHRWLTNAYINTNKIPGHCQDRNGTAPNDAPTLNSNAGTGHVSTMDLLARGLLARLAAESDGQESLAIRPVLGGEGAEVGKTEVIVRPADAILRAD